MFSELIPRIASITKLIAKVLEHPGLPANSKKNN